MAPIPATGIHLANTDDFIIHKALKVIVRNLQNLITFTARVYLPRTYGSLLLYFFLEGITCEAYLLPCQARGTLLFHVGTSLEFLRAAEWICFVSFCEQLGAEKCDKLYRYIYACSSE